MASLLAALNQKEGKKERKSLLGPADTFCFVCCE
jgi:hypothetical protein